MTTVIGIGGGPGCGKSTFAAALFAELKMRGASCELVREYVKPWAWRGQVPGRWDELYLLAKQLREESALYGKVRLIVSDRPLWMSAVYEELLNLPPLAGPAVQALLQQQAAEGIQHIDFLVQRTKAFDPSGRYQTESQARAVDAACKRLRPTATEVSLSDVQLLATSLESRS
jgi:hypothetical protein